jgi:hypothetical protein
VRLIFGFGQLFIAMSPEQFFGELGFPSLGVFRLALLPPLTFGIFAAARAHHANFGSSSFLGIANSHQISVHILEHCHSGLFLPWGTDGISNEHLPSALSAGFHDHGFRRAAINQIASP